MAKSLLYILLIVICSSCSYDQSSNKLSTPFTHSPRTLSTQYSHDEVCQAPYIREDILNTYHYLISESVQAEACDALYEAGYSLDKRGLLEEGIVEDKVEALGSQYKTFGLKDKVTIGIMVASTLLGLLISYEIYQRKKMSGKHSPLSEKKQTTLSLLASFQQAKDEYLLHKMPQRYRQQLEDIWQSVFEWQSKELWLLKADLLDEVDKLVQMNPDDILPISFDKHPNYLVGIPPSKHFVPLVEYNDIGHFTQTMAYFDNLSDDELISRGIKKTDLSGVDKTAFIGLLESQGGKAFIKESSKIGSVINAVYKKDGVINQLTRSKFLLKTMTHYMGWNSRRKATPLSIAGTARTLGITPYEVTSYAHGQRVYRGPSYLFGKNIREFENFNTFFVRDLTPTAREDYLRDAKEKNASLLASYHRANDAGVSAIVISNADARLRFTTLNKGELGKPQKIVGKVLNEAAAEMAKNQSDNPIYYGEKYDFKVSDSFLVDVDSTGKRRTNDFETQHFSPQLKLNNAKAELLGLLYDDMNQRGVIQVTQRLAPADIHNYTAAVNGTALNHLEAVEFLENKMNVAGADKNPKLEKLKHFFVDQASENLGSVIEISGNQYSVSTEAVSHKPNILAQNNRKIMMLKHEGTDMYSIHIFIGATGVDQVNIDEGAVYSEQGDRLGDMAFGSESGGHKLKAGKPIGRFPVNGSTVQSFYFTDDFELLPDITAYNKAFGNKEFMPEIRAKMGNPILKMKTNRLDDVTADLFAEDLLKQHDRTFDWDKDKIITALRADHTRRNLIPTSFDSSHGDMFIHKIIEAGKAIQRRRR